MLFRSINASAATGSESNAWNEVVLPTTWVEVDLADGARAEYIYGADTSQAALTGQIIVTSTGRAGSGTNEVSRTIEAIIVKRSSVDYAWFTDSEALHPDYPGLYCADDVPKNKLGQDCPRGMMHKSNAEILCATHYAGTDGSPQPGRYWWQNGPGLLTTYDSPQPPLGTAQIVTLPSVSLYHRNSARCLTEPILTPKIGRAHV